MASIARIGIQTDTRDAEKGVKSVRQMFGDLGKDIKGGIAAGLGIGAGLSAFNAVQSMVRGVLDGVRDSITAASDLAESQSKVNVVFGESAAQVQDWSKKSASAFGLSRQAALEAAGTYGNLFQAFGIGREQANQMSTSLVGLAADLASFNNTSVDDAIQALRSGLSGETEPLKRFGVAINDVRLKEEALRLGLIETTKGVLPTAIKTQAAYALIMKDTALAQGDFARTSDGLANQQKILQANLQNVSAELGEKLLPLVLKLATFANDVLVPALRDVFGTIDDLVTNTGREIDTLTDAFRVAQIYFGDLGKDVEDRANQIGADVGTMKNLVIKAMNDMGLGIDEAITYAEQRMAGIPLAATDAGRRTIAAWKQADLGGATGDAVGPMGDAIVDTVEDAKTEATEVARKIPGSLADAILAGADDLDPVRQAITDILAGSVTDGAALAENAATLVNPGITKGLTSNSLETRQAMLHDVIEPLVASMNTLNPEALHSGEGIPAGLRDGVFAQRDRAIDEVRALRDDMAPEMDLAEFAEAHGLESIASYIRGMQAKKRDATVEAHRVAEGAVGAMNISGAALAGGSAVGHSWFNGLTSAFAARNPEVATAVNAIKRQLGGSLPEDGPLKGDTAEKGGKSVGSSWISGIVASIGGGLGRVHGLLGQVGSELRGPSGSAGLSPSAAGGSPTVIQIQLDGRTIAEVIDPWLYRLQPGGTSVLPRGS